MFRKQSSEKLNKLSLRWYLLNAVMNYAENEIKPTRVMEYNNRITDLPDDELLNGVLCDVEEVGGIGVLGSSTRLRMYLLKAICQYFNVSDSRVKECILSCAVSQYTGYASKQDKILILCSLLRESIDSNIETSDLSRPSSEGLAY